MRKRILSIMLAVITLLMSTMQPLALLAYEPSDMMFDYIAFEEFFKELDEKFNEAILNQYSYFFIDPQIVEAEHQRQLDEIMLELQGRERGAISNDYQARHIGHSFSMESLF